MESMVLFARGSEITLEDLPQEYRTLTSTEPISQGEWTPREMADIEKEAILRTLRFTGDHRGKAANLLGIGLRTLQRKLKEYGEILSED